MGGFPSLGWAPLASKLGPKVFRGVHVTRMSWRVHMTKLKIANLISGGVLLLISFR
jgi:hypothetical protein